ncbi:MAG: AsmA-like C-terminal region-containing protein, partial [Myxococcota bacterium]
YDDRQGKIRARIDDLDLSARGSVSGDRTRFATTTTIGGLTVKQGGVTWLDRVKVDAKVALDAAASGQYTFGDNTVSLNALPLAFSGTVWPKEAATDLDLKFQVLDTTFKSVLSLVPSAFDDSFRGVDASGGLALTGSAVGAYRSADALPAFDVALSVTDGRFKYPSLPTGVDDVDLTLALHHPGGPKDALVIDVPAMSLTAAGTRVRGQAHVEHPVTDPDLTAKIAGVVDLAALRKALPTAAEAAPPSGRVELDVDVAGRMSAFQSGKTDRVKAEGTVSGTDVRYVSEGWPDLMIRSFDVGLGPQTAELRDARISYDDSDLRVNGTADGLLPYLMTDTGTLVGRFHLLSNRLDLRPFQGEEVEAPAASVPPGPAPGTAEPMIVPVPGNVDLAGTAKIGTLVMTDTATMTDVDGTAIVRDGAVRMDSIHASMMGGTVALSGVYLAPTADSADLDLTITGVKLDIAQTVKSFVTMRKLAPLLDGVTGRYDSGITMKVRLGPDGSPDLRALASSGVLAPAAASLRPAALAEASQKLGGDRFGQLDVGGTEIRYVFDNGKVDLKPFTAKLGPAPVTIAGTAGVVDETLDFLLKAKIPTNLLKGTPLLATAKKALGKTADVTVKLTGTWDRPKVAIGLDGGALLDAVKDVADDVLTDALAEARRQGDALVVAAEAQASTLRAQGKLAADKLRSEAKKQGDKLVSEAKGNPLKEAAAKEGAKQLAAQAEKGAVKAEAEADKAADALVAEAKSKRDALLAEAQRKKDAATR